jgi:hypothetical protein
MLRQIKVSSNLSEYEKQQRTSRCFKASFCFNGEPELQSHSKYLKKSSSSENDHRTRRIVLETPVPFLYAEYSKNAYKPEIRLFSINVFFHKSDISTTVVVVLFRYILQ